MEFLVRELNGKRPLLPPDLPMSPEVRLCKEGRAGPLGLLLWWWLYVCFLFGFLLRFGVRRGRGGCRVFVAVGSWLGWAAVLPHNPPLQQLSPPPLPHRTHPPSRWRT